MTAFKVGDVVRRTRCDNSGLAGWVLKVGQQALVWEVEGCGWLKVVAEGVPMDEHHNNEFFELVSRKVADPVVTARTNDPATSKAVALHVEPKKPSIKATILSLLRSYPEGLTGQEIAAISGVRLNSITPRFAELSRATGSAYLRTLGPIRDSLKQREGQIVWVLSERSTT